MKCCTFHTSFCTARQKIYFCCDAATQFDKCWQNEPLIERKEIHQCQNHDKNSHSICHE